MPKQVSVKIIGFKVEGTAARIYFKFSNGKRIDRVIGMDDAMSKRFRVGSYIQIYIGDSEYEEIFGGKKLETWIDMSESQ